MFASRYHIHAILFLVATVLVLSCKENPVSSSQDADPSIEDHLDAKLADQINAYLETISNEAAGLSVLVRYNDEVVYYGSRGLGNKAPNKLLSEHSLFRLASVSKTFTAVAIMQLVEKEEIKLDDSVLKYFPEFDASWEPITIHMLLTHRAGTYDFLNDYIGSSWRQNITNQKVIDYFVENPKLKFAPGSQGVYSNSNYVLLAEIISRVKGVSFAAYMKETIFEPLGMTHTYCRDSDTPLSEKETLNYADRDTYFNIYTYTVGPMGMVSSVYEIDLFMRALSKGELLSANSLGQMRIPYSNFFGASYGYGLMFGDDWYGHGGSLDGAQTNITFYPQRNAYLITLSNGGSRTYNYMREVAAMVEAYY